MTELTTPIRQAADLGPTRAARSFDWIDTAVMILPGILLYVLLVIGPIVQTFILSFVDWELISPDRKFVGLDNYVDLLGSARFWNALKNNVIWAGLGVIPVALGLVLAALVVQSKIWGATFFRICFVLPFTLSPVIVAVVWGWIYQNQWGTVNVILRAVGLEAWARPWLSDPSTALIAMNMVGGWTWFGFCMVIFIAGLQSIPSELYDAAEVDGASERQRFFYVTVPMLRPQIYMISIVTLIFSFKVFDIVFVMTRGGPFQTSEVLGLLVYIQGFQFYKIGDASATAVVLTILVFAISALVQWRSGKWQR